MKSQTGGLVYSTEHGRMCPACQQPQQACTCQSTPAPVAVGPVRVQLETKGRKGKGVTVIASVPLAEPALSAFAKRLRQHCGSGGTVKTGVIEIQGDHLDKVIPLLQAEGWTVKKVGG